jgi:hypothetical protein
MPNAYKILVRETEWKRLLGKRKCKLEENTEMDTFNSRTVHLDFIKVFVIIHFIFKILLLRY